MIQNVSLGADYFGQRTYLRSRLDDVDINQFMIDIVAPSLGISTNTYDSQHDAAVEAFENSFMVPSVEKGYISYRPYIHLKSKCGIILKS